MNSITKKKSPTITQVGHTSLSIVEDDSLFFEDKCELLRSLFVIFFSVV